MEKLKIRVQSLEDAKNGIPLIEGPEPGNTEETEDVTIGFLENGMASGKTSVMICLKMEDGTYKIGQISNGNFIGLMAAFRGAVSRFEDREL